MRRNQQPQETWLFDDSQSWRSQPSVAFASFIASAEFMQLGKRELAGRAANPEAFSGATTPTIGAASAKVYGAMFSSFTNYLEAFPGPAPIRVPDATASHISGFMAASERTDNVRIRYIRLLERVYEHLVRRSLILENPVHKIAARVISDKDSCVPELPTAFVSKYDQANIVESMIQAVRDRGDWRSVRDAAIAAVLLGAGLKVYEATAMRTQWVHGRFPDYVIEVPQVGISRVHRIPLAPFAADCLNSWMDLRRDLSLVQPLMFVGSLKEGRLQSAAGALDKSTVYRRIKAILVAAGVDVPRMGGRTLRNTYAAKALSDGASPELVEERLGLRESKSMERYLTASKAL